MHSPRRLIVKAVLFNANFFFAMHFAAAAAVFCACAVCTNRKKLNLILTHSVMHKYKRNPPNEGINPPNVCGSAHGTIRLVSQNCSKPPTQTRDPPSSRPLHRKLHQQRRITHRENANPPSRKMCKLFAHRTIPTFKHAPTENAYTMLAAQTQFQGLNYPINLQQRVHKTNVNSFTIACV